MNDNLTGRAQAINELNKAQDILMADLPVEMREMSVQEFDATNLGKAIRLINNAIEILDDMEE
jgi:hypothetical protein